MSDAYLVEAVRTPMGAFRGALAGERPDDLAAHAVAAAVERSGVDPEQITDVYMGAANQAGEDNRDVAQMAALLAGLPVAIPGATVNRLCASGLEAVNQAARCVMLGEGDVYLAGGVESMSRAPWVVAKPERGLPRGEQTMHDTTLGWRLINPRMAEAYSTEAMGATAENVAQRHRGSAEKQGGYTPREPPRAAARASRVKSRTDTGCAATSARSPRSKQAASPRRSRRSRRRAGARPASSRSTRGRARTPPRKSSLGCGRSSAMGAP